MSQYQKFHSDMTDEKWQQMPLVVQLSHIGGDVVRAVRWKEKGREKQAEQALFRALELLELTLASLNSAEKLKEICRVKELILDYIIGENEYNSKPDDWYNYFKYFDLSTSELRR